jgi:hypothetical protein
LQANLVLNEGLASGYESEVLADFMALCSWGISLIASIAERNSADEASVGLRRVRVGSVMIPRQRLMG